MTIHKQSQWNWVKADPPDHMYKNFLKMLTQICLTDQAVPGCRSDTASHKQDFSNDLDGQHASHVYTSSQYKVQKDSFCT